jgi:hypothetical protein
MKHDDSFFEQLPSIVKEVQPICELSSYSITPKLITQLRELYPHYPNEIISRIIDLAIYSHRAKSASGYAGVMPWLFTEQTYVQSSEPAFADHVIARLNVTSYTFIEICTGSGMHAYSACKHGAREVITYELDPFIASLAKLNTIQHGYEINSLCIDGSSAEVTSEDILWADPSRRTNGKDRKKLSGIYAPDLTILIEKARKAKRAGIKIAPGERIEGDYSKEFLGSGRECREQILWFNTDVIDGSVTLIDKRKTFVPMAKGYLPKCVDKDSIRDYAYLLEPHPALIRGDLTSMYVEHDIALIDGSIAYGLTNMLQDADWFTHFRILHQEAYSRRRLQECIKQFQWNALTEIKKRGFPIEPDDIRKQLKFDISSEKFGVVILTRKDNDHQMFFCERV